MAERIVVAADLGASGGKMARGSFDGRTLKVGDFFDFPNQPVDLNRDLYWDLFGLYKSILSGLKRYGAETEWKRYPLIPGELHMDFWIIKAAFWSQCIITGICGRSIPWRKCIR